MILILNPWITFDQLARTLDRQGWTITRVRSCTFPSRPEPKEVEWALGRLDLCARYIYEPDVEVRAIDMIHPKIIAQELGVSCIRSWFDAHLQNDNFTSPMNKKETFAHEVTSRRASAEQLITLPLPDAAKTLEQVKRHDPDLDVRLHAHRAHEALRIHLCRTRRTP